MNSTAAAAAPNAVLAGAPNPDANLEGLRARARNMARVTAEHALAVDHEARFPKEAFAQARSERLLGMLVPKELGGDGASVSDVADVSYMLGQACASTSMIFSMHSIMVAILVRHARNSPWHQGFMRKIASEQLLVASSTTEGLGGGDLRSSSCFVEPTGDQMKLSRAATCVSYGAEADALMTTARRSADSAPNDQVLVALLKSDYQLDPIVGWDVMGMRGTASTGFAVKGTGAVEQVLPAHYDSIHKHSMGPIASLLWGATWSGAAAGAVARARQFVRSVARQGNGQLPPGTPHLTRATMSLRALRGQVASALQRFEAAGSNAEVLESLDFQTAMTLLKVNNSELSIETVMSALRACGLSGYREEGEFSVTRHLRDVLSSMIMINNDRILANATNAAMLVDVPSYLRD
jgi:acyl-CoA dehydrogenase